MSSPKIAETIGGYEFRWVDLELSISVSKLHVHSDGHVTGFLDIRTTRKGFNPILYPPTQFNFSSPRTRTSLVKELTESFPDWPWEGVIYQISLHVQDLTNRGEPVVELWTSADVPRPEWLLEPILYRGLPTIIFGEKAVAKSTLALAVYACLTLPWAENPLGWTAPARPLKVLLADWEVDANVAQWNAKQLQEGMDLGAFPLHYRRCSRPLADDVEQFQKHLANLGAEVLIVDSLGPAVGGKLNEPEQALAFTTALRKLKVSSLIIGQTSKGGDTKTKAKASVYGSTFFSYFARNIFELKRVQEEGETTLDIALYNTYNNLGRRSPAQGFHLFFNGSGTHIEQQEITAPELVARLGTQAGIRKLLLGGAKTVEEIAESLELKESNIRVALSRLKKGGKITKIGETWGLLANEEEL